MNVLIYDIFIFVYNLAIRLAALKNKKARQWVAGRKSLPLIEPGAECIWMHCASLGEFEQGRPVFEALKRKYPQYRYLVTFFSPSGYEIRKRYKEADHVFYLPVDTASHAKKVIENWKPKLVIWVKYEYWFHFLDQLHKKNIPVVLLSAHFRSSQHFFKWWGGFWKSILHRFTFLYVQNSNSAELLQKINLGEKTLVTGDTRYDQVLKLKSANRAINGITQFIGNKCCLVAGSTWSPDEKLLHSIHLRFPELKIIIAPHEINNHHLNQLQDLFKDAVLYSSYEKESDPDIKKNILIIDNIGMLSALYRYGKMAYIGGGFNKSGIHNTLEAAVYGVPVIFGPNYQKFEEAVRLIGCGGGFSIEDANQLGAVTDRLMHDESHLLKSGNEAAKLVLKNAGATQKIIDHIEGNLLLTS